MRRNGDPAGAVDAHQEALAIAATPGELQTQALSHDGIAKALTALGNAVDAREHRERALRL
ncbi:MAG TPA: hypothetical protein VH333_13865 [Pseudonocardiaceae bacterium]|nr:hypothetical protein [Pseudonocardiaceae bacterium]